MATEIFENVHEFRRRPDKRVNGVSPKFAKANRSWKSDNATNVGCWNCKSCKDCMFCEWCVRGVRLFKCSKSADCTDCKLCKLIKGLTWRMNEEWKKIPFTPLEKAIIFV